MTALADRDTHVISDAHVHASLIDAVRLSRAHLTVVPYNDVDAVRTAPPAAPGGPRAHRVDLLRARRPGAPGGPRRRVPRVWRLAAGRRGPRRRCPRRRPGARPRPGRPARRRGHRHPLQSLGSQGGAVLGPAALVEHLVNTARPFIFDTGLSPAAAAAALAAARIARAEPALAATVHARVDGLAELLGVAPPAGAVLSVPMPHPGPRSPRRPSCSPRGARRLLPAAVGARRDLAAAGHRERRRGRGGVAAGRKALDAVVLELGR